MIYALIILVVYLAYVLYFNRLISEFRDYFNWLPEWFGQVFKTREVINELGVAWYEFVEALKVLLQPLKTLAKLSLLLLAPTILPFLLLLLVIVDEHRSH